MPENVLSVNKQKVEIKVEITGAQQLPTIYANHFAVGLTPSEVEIVFAYMDGLVVGELVSRNPNGPHHAIAKPVSRVTLSHRAMIDLAKNLNNLIERMTKATHEQTAIEKK